MKYSYCSIPSPIGDITLVADNDNLCAIYWPNQEPDRVKFPELEKKDDNLVLNAAEKQLKDYFSGKREDFDIPQKPNGTEFQQQVWSALISIGYGETVSYSDIAKRIGRPRAARAVGAAIGKNPLSIIVPCHRVIGSDGKLTGFGGGLQIKKYLLNLENGAHTS